MAEQEPSKNQQLYLLAIAGVIIVILIALWLLFAKEQTVEPTVNLMPPVVNEPVQQEPEAEPVTETVETAPEADTVEPVTVAEPEAVVTPEPAIPALDDSDTEVRQRLLALDWRPGLASLFVTEDMLRSFAVQVDNIAQGQLAAGSALLQPLEQKFTVEDGAKLQLDEASFKRYEPYIQLLESVKPAQLVALFNRYEPLLQQAYAELGYPDQLFKNKLIEAIDELLATPEVNYPLALERPAVVYVFADPAIEQLPAAQKQMIRLGPDNQRKIRALLQQYRALLNQN